MKRLYFLAPMLGVLFHSASASAKPAPFDVVVGVQYDDEEPRVYKGPVDGVLDWNVANVQCNLFYEKYAFRMVCTAGKTVVYDKKSDCRKGPKRTMAGYISKKGDPKSHAYVVVFACVPGQEV